MLPCLLHARHVDTACLPWRCNGVPLCQQAPTASGIRSYHAVSFLSSRAAALGATIPVLCSPGQGCFVAPESTNQRQSLNSWLLLLHCSYSCLTPRSLLSDSFPRLWHLCPGYLHLTSGGFFVPPAGLSLMPLPSCCTHGEAVPVGSGGARDQTPFGERTSTKLL